VTTHLPRYPASFVTSLAEFERYLAAHEEFYVALPEELRSRLRVRPHRDDFGWNIAGRWQRFAPEVQIEDWNVSFEASLRACRLYVCDHHSTTFAEALSVDKPSVLFWDPRSVDLAPEYRHLYEALRAAGILHDSARAAAAHVARVYADTVGWWQGPEVQAARLAFCKRLALTVPDAIDLWAAELLVQGTRREQVPP
jgi:putative transferase (TIGR04331 family)